MKALCQLESLLPPCASCQVLKIALLQWSRLICSCRLLCSPWRSCVQYLYNSPWLFKVRKKSGGSGCRPRVFLFGITTLLEDQRESGALCLLMGRSPPTGSYTTCVYEHPRLFLISPSLFSHVSETSLNFMPPRTHPPIHQPLLSHFCPLPLVCLFWTPLEPGHASLGVLGLLT